MRFSLNVAFEGKRLYLPARWRGWPMIFVVLLAASALLFMALPWSLEGKSMAVLHGICAQQPNHSFYFGDGRLPFDARMTGIYGGFLITSGTLFALGRWRAAGLPPIAILTLIGALILPLAIDGVNSTVYDLRGWSLYPPQNELRLVTGLLAGVTLAAFVWMLVGQVGFKRAANTPTPLVRNMREIGLVLVAQAAFAAVVLTEWEPLRVPLSLALLVAAVAALSGLMLGFVLLFTRRENQAVDSLQLAGPATAALLCAFLLLATTSASRFLLEAIVGVPTAV
jgi:uncharacterized membrane protein